MTGDWTGNLSNPLSAEALRWRGGLETARRKLSPVYCQDPNRGPGVPRLPRDKCLLLGVYKSNTCMKYFSAAQKNQKCFQHQKCWWERIKEELVGKDGDRGGAGIEG